MKSQARPPWTPSPEQMQLWPAVSGNTLNGLGEPRVRRPSPVYWHAPEATPYGPLQRWFYARATAAVHAARQERQRAIDEPLVDVAPAARAYEPPALTARLREVALADSAADDLGIARVQPQWVFEGHEVKQTYVIVLAVQHDWDKLRTAPQETAAAEVITQYARGIRAAKRVANFLRGEGHDASPHGGPMAFPMLLIPAAVAAGLGELGKHGSMIHRRLGSNFRLACVLTDVPLVVDDAQTFGADSFCMSCQACSKACPPQAISAEKQLVRGETKWYVNFDKCLPYFNEHQGCAVCLAACPWNLPGVAQNLVRKLASR